MMEWIKVSFQGFFGAEFMLSAAEARLRMTLWGSKYDEGNLDVAFEFLVSCPEFRDKGLTFAPSTLEYIQSYEV